MDNMSLLGLITKQQIETEVTDWQKQTVKLVETVNEYNKQNEIISAQQQKNKDFDKENEHDVQEAELNENGESTDSSSQQAIDKHELNIDSDTLEAASTMSIADEKSDIQIASGASHEVMETSTTDVTTSAASSTDMESPTVASTMPSGPAEATLSISHTVVTVDEMEPTVKAAPKRKRVASAESKALKESAVFVIPAKRSRLQYNTAEVVTQKSFLSSSSAATRDAALDFFASLYDPIRGFPMVRDVVESGAVEELVLLSEKLASQQDVSKRVTTILCNIVLKCDTSNKRSVVEAGVLSVLCEAVRWKDATLNELVCRSIAFLITSRAKRFQEMAMDCNLFTALVQAFNGGDSLQETHHHIAAILAEQVHHKVAPDSLRPVIRMLVGLMQTNNKQTVVCACNVLTYILGVESNAVILEALRAGIVAVIGKLLKNDKLDRTIVDRVLCMLENLSMTDEAVTIAELVSAEHKLLSRIVSDRIRSDKIKNVLSGLRFFCNVCVSESVDVRQAVADSGVLLLLPAHPHLQSPPVKELAMQAVLNFATGATYEQMQHIMGADGAITMLCDELVLGATTTPRLNDETAKPVVFALQSLSYLLEACSSTEQTNAFIALINTSGGMKAIEQLKSSGRKDVKDCACALKLEKVQKK